MGGRTGRGNAGGARPIIAAMPVLRSRLDPAERGRRAPTSTRWPSSSTDLRARQAAVERSGRRRRRHARSRDIASAASCRSASASTGSLDPGSAFLELSALAADGLYDDEAPSAGIVTGVGRIEGTTCVIVANDATVKGGTYYPMTVKKHLRAQEIALENRLPCVYLVDSGGAFLPLQADVFPDREHFGRIFYNQARMSAAGDPAGRAGDGLVDRRRRVRAGDERRDRHRQGHRHDLPRRAAAGEGRHGRGGLGRGSRRRGGPRPRVGRRRPRGARRRARARPRSVDRRQPQPPATDSAVGSPRAREPPRRSTAAGLYAAISRRPAAAVPVRELIARLVDGSRFHEFKPLYGETLVTGFAHIDGWPVGIIANDGILFSQSALKGAHFIELACQRRIPLVFLQNITGFMVGREYEEGGIAKDGAKLVTAVASRRGPQVHGPDRRVLRGRQLRDGRSGVPAALPVDVAEHAGSR